MARNANVIAQLKKAKATLGWVRDDAGKCIKEVKGLIQVFEMLQDDKYEVIGSNFTTQKFMYIDFKNTKGA